MSPKILVLGATGFTGRHTVPLLQEVGMTLRCLVRQSASGPALLLKTFGVELVQGDLDHPDTLAGAFEGIGGLISMVSLGNGYAKTIVDFSLRFNLQRALFLSTTALFTKLNATTKRIRLEAESAIRHSGLAYTILRPTMIYGTGEDRNISRLIAYLAKWPVVFIPGSGNMLQQPIYVGDVARAIVDAFLASNTVGRSYNIAGREPLTFNQLVETTCLALGRRVTRLHLPVQTLVRLLKICEKKHWPIPIRSEQIERLDEHKAFDYDEASKDFGFASLSFSQGVRCQIAAMGFKPSCLTNDGADCCR